MKCIRYRLYDALIRTKGAGAVPGSREKLKLPEPRKFCDISNVIYESARRLQGIIPNGSEAGKEDFHTLSYFSSKRFLVLDTGQLSSKIVIHTESTV